jgi:hypothetical protein
MSDLYDADLKATQDKIVHSKTNGFDLLLELVRGDNEMRKHMGCSDFEKWVTNHVVRVAREYTKAVEEFEKRWPDGEAA